MGSPIDEFCGVSVDGVARRIEGVEEVIRVTSIPRTQSRSFETRREIGDLSVEVKVLEKIISYRGDITCIKASLRQCCKISIFIEVIKESFSRRSDFTEIEASDWQTRERSMVVEVIKEEVSYGGKFARIETSCW